MGVDAEVFKVFCQDKVLQRFVKQIIEDGDDKKIFKVFSQDWVSWVLQRCVEPDPPTRGSWGPPLTFGGV